jgi:hypothetical protein
MFVVESVPAQASPSYILLERLNHVRFSKSLFLQNPARTAPNRTQKRCSSTRQDHHVGICGAHAVAVVCHPSSLIPHLCPVGIPHPFFHVGVLWGSSP